MRRLEKACTASGHRPEPLSQSQTTVQLLIMDEIQVIYQGLFPGFLNCPDIALVSKTIYLFRLSSLSACTCVCVPFDAYWLLGSKPLFVKKNGVICEWYLKSDVPGPAIFWKTYQIILVFF